MVRIVHGTNSPGGYEQSTVRTVQGRESPGTTRSTSLMLYGTGSRSARHAGSASGRARHCYQRCFFQLRQLRRIRRPHSTMCLWRPDASPCICHESHRLVQRPAGRWTEVMTDKLQRVMNAAARIVTNTRKFDHSLTRVRYDILHWLDVPERITFKLCMEWDRCIWPADLVGGWPSSMRSADRGQLVVPRYRLTTAGRRTFSCTGPSAWNSLPACRPMKDESLSLASVKRSLNS